MVETYCVTSAKRLSAQFIPSVTSVPSRYQAGLSTFKTQGITLRLRVNHNTALPGKAPCPVTARGAWQATLSCGQAVAGHLGQVRDQCKHAQVTLPCPAPCHRGEGPQVEL